MLGSIKPLLLMAVTIHFYLPNLLRKKKICEVSICLLKYFLLFLAINFILLKTRNNPLGKRDGRMCSPQQQWSNEELVRQWEVWIIIKIKTKDKIVE